MADNVPPLPAGFQLESTPPLPPGFQLEGDQEQEAAETAPGFFGSEGMEAFAQGVVRGVPQPQGLPDDPRFAAFRQQRQQELGESHPGATLAGQLVAGAPEVLVPGGGARAATRIGIDALVGAAQGAIPAAIQGGTPDELAAGIGAGAALGSLPQTALAGVRAARPAVTNVMDRARQVAGFQTPGMAQRLGATNLTPEAQARLEAARRLGIQITPAEAAGDPVLAARQGGLGTSEAGARRMTDFQQGRATVQAENIGSALRGISTEEGSAALRVRDVAKDIIKKRSDALQEKAKPLYDKLDKIKVPRKLADRFIKDPLILDTLREISRDPVWASELRKLPQSSITRFDLVKRRLDDMRSTAMRAGERDRARLIGEARNRLVNALDKFAPDYKAARLAYSEDAPALQALRDSPLGKVASLEDADLKKVTKMLFDPSEIDPKQVAAVRREFLKADPAAWRQILRNEMERRLDAVAGERTGDSFYRNILAKPRDFELFMRAADGLPEVQKKLVDMRKVYPVLTQAQTVRGAAGKAQQNLDAPRNMYDAIATTLKNVSGGRMDKAAVELITDPKWDSAWSQVSQAQPSKRPEIIATLIARAAAGQSGDNNGN
jgi:hypothetical protein